ncbi:hypothetical protein OUZ56_005519 [Daphnia magna]|uniref:Uncharacterized protein n=1 Tax=Daphnia magna TaxID=35525 RepID=A0ABQ9YT03_9CRUS|nr:hypothetical protein OUZ56_005519 [Daphnia magna]
MSGVVFQNLGEVNFSDSEWVVVTEGSFRQVEATLGHLEQWLAEKLKQHEGGPLNEDFKIGNRIKEQLTERATGCLEELGVVKSMGDRGYAGHGAKITFLPSDVRIMAEHPLDIYVLNG